MQTDRFDPEKSEFLQPSESEIQTWMSKAFDMVKTLMFTVSLTSIYHDKCNFPSNTIVTAALYY